MTLTQKDFHTKISESKIAVVNIGASWCPDCRKIEPIFKQMKDEYSDIAFYKVDFDESEELKETLNIKRIPTIIFYKNGKEVASRLVEPDNRAQIEAQLKIATE